MVKKVEMVNAKDLVWKVFQLGFEMTLSKFEHHEEKIHKFPKIILINIFLIKIPLNIKSQSHVDCFEKCKSCIWKYMKEIFHILRIIYKVESWRPPYDGARS
jgi:hypothetical protein